MTISRRHASQESSGASASHFDDVGIGTAESNHAAIENLRRSIIFGVEPIPYIFAALFWGGHGVECRVGRREALQKSRSQRKLASEVVQPSRQAGEAYVASHPDMFANRRVLFVNQVIAAPSNISPDRLRPLKTLDAVRSLLESEGVQYQENAVVLDTLSANPQLIALVKGLPAGEIFVVPQQGSLLFNQITGERSTPFRGDMATAYAVNQLRSQTSQTTISKRLEALRKAADDKIVYSDAYKPSKPKAVAKAAAKPAPAAAAAGSAAK